MFTVPWTHIHKFIPPVTSDWPMAMKYHTVISLMSLIIRFVALWNTSGPWTRFFKTFLKQHRLFLDGCNLHLVWNKSQLPTWCKRLLIVARHVSGLYAHLQERARWWWVALQCNSPPARKLLKTPSCTKDTICCICKGNYIFYCSWRWAYKAETCRAKINKYLHQVGNWLLFIPKSL